MIPSENMAKQGFPIGHQLKSNGISSETHCTQKQLLTSWQEIIGKLFLETCPWEVIMMSTEPKTTDENKW